MKASQALEMRATCEKGSTRLTVRGELDRTTVPRFEGLLSDLRARKQVVRLDFSKLEFMDAMGFRSVLRALHDRRAGMSVLEVDPEISPAVSQLIGLLGTAGLGEA